MSTTKIMCTVFCDRQGILLVEFLTRGMTINAAAYCETLNKLQHAIQNKRRGTLRAGVMFLQNKAHPHAAAQHASCLLHSNGNCWITPYRLCLFLHLKKCLASKKLDSDEELQERALRNGSLLRRPTSRNKAHATFTISGAIRNLKVSIVCGSELVGRTLM